MFGWLKRIFDRSDDPVYSCDLYRDKEAGSCAHVDGKVYSEEDPVKLLAILARMITPEQIAAAFPVKSP